MFTQHALSPLGGILGIGALTAVSVWLYYSMNGPRHSENLFEILVPSPDKASPPNATGPTFKHESKDEPQPLDTPFEREFKTSGPPSIEVKAVPLPLNLVPTIAKDQNIVENDGSASHVVPYDAQASPGFDSPSVLYPSIDNKNITLAFRADPHDTAETYYAKVSMALALSPMKDYLRIIVRVIPDNNWSEEGLQKLGQGLARLAAADIAKLHRCSSLRVILPKAKGLPSNTAAHTVLTLPALKQLFWHSHRNQLPLLSPETSFSNITSLTLKCDISTRDCAFLLMKGAQTLTTVKIRTVFNDDTKSIFPAPVILDGDKRVKMMSLTFLTIASTCDIGPMLNQFDFPRLRKINFDIADYIPHFSQDFKTIVWEELQETWLKCDFSREDPKWIEACIVKANPGAYHNHVHRHYTVHQRPESRIIT